MNSLMQSTMSFKPLSRSWRTIRPSDEEAIDAWDERCDRIRDLMDELEDKMDEM